MAVQLSSLVIVVVISSLLLPACFASSHSEAPGSVRKIQTDATDLYLFRSYEKGREDFVTIIANFYPLQDPFGGPTYFALSDDFFYEIYIDNDGDAVEDLTFQFFAGNRLGGKQNKKGKHIGIALNIGGEEIPIALKTAGPITKDDQSNLNFFETYRVNFIFDGPRETGTVKPIKKFGTKKKVFVRPFDNSGVKTFPGTNGYKKYARQFEYDIKIPKCSTAGRMFVGTRQESFSVNLGEIFDLVNFTPLDKSQTPNGGIKNRKKNNVIRNKNIASFILEVPIECLVGSGNGVIGAWIGARKLKHDADGNHVAKKQITRLGNPLVNEVVIGLKDKDKFNKRKPPGDAKFLKYVTNPTLPAIINLVSGDDVNAALGTSHSDIAPTNFPRNDLVAIFLTGLAGINQLQTVTPSEMMRLNTNIPPTKKNDQSPLGLFGGDNAGFPNGRRPGDDVVDIALLAVMGRACHVSALGLCDPSDAPTGDAAWSDGAPVSADDFKGSWPYLNEPLPGSS